MPGHLIIFASSDFPSFSTLCHSHSVIPTTPCFRFL